MSLWLSGIGVSRGISIARVQKMHAGDLEVPEYALTAEQIPAEIARFEQAHAVAKEQLRQVRQGYPGAGGRSDPKRHPSAH